MAMHSGTPWIPGSREVEMLQVEDLRVHFHTEEGIAKAVDGISFRLERGTTHVLVGESGSGKSVTALAITGLLPQVSTRIPSGKILFQGQNLLELSRPAMREIRGAGIGMVFQEPMTALNPVVKVGYQIIEAIRIHPARALGEGVKPGKQAFQDRAIELMGLCGLKEPQSVFHKYPHELSGGMRQRIVIAIALSCNPDLIIADEPTTALDVTIQAQILDLMADLQKKTGTGILLITHDLAVASRFGHTMSVMYAGQVVESGTTREIFSDPCHPYTISLLNSLPDLSAKGRSRLQAIPGQVPPATAYDSLPSQCRFYERCPYQDDRCFKKPASDSHFSWCGRREGK